MSLSDLMAADVAGVFLQTDDFASVLLRFANGDEGNANQITAIVTIHPAMVDDATGRGYMQRGELFISETTKLNPGDAVKHDGKRYEVEAVSAAEHGAKTASIVRYQSEAKGAKPLRNGDL